MDECSISPAEAEMARAAMAFCESVDLADYPHTAKAHIYGLAEIILYRHAKQPATRPEGE